MYVVCMGVCVCVKTRKTKICIDDTTKADLRGLISADLGIFH